MIYSGIINLKKLGSARAPVRPQKNHTQKEDRFTALEYTYNTLIIKE